MHENEKYMYHKLPITMKSQFKVFLGDKISVL